MVGKFDSRREVHVWQAFTEDAKPHAGCLIATLNADEKARGERLLDPEHCQRFLLGQAILRDVLSRYTHQPAEALVFTRGKHGKPYLVESDLQFNLTHSNECVLVAVAVKKEVGIDVEHLACMHNFDGLVKRFFSQEEQKEYFLYTSGDERRLAFYRGWTRKEAYLKAIGLGLSYPLDKCVMSLKAGETHALLRVEDDTTVHAKWTIQSFTVGKDYLASFAIEMPLDKVQTHYWSFCSTS